MSFRWAIAGLALLMFGACAPGGGSTSGSSSGNGCGRPGICLTLTGPLAGATSGLVQVPDCIPGGGLDVVFITHVGAHETTIEILVTDHSAKATPGFQPGSFAIRPSGDTQNPTAFASIYIKPDIDIAGFRGGWTTNAATSSGTVTVNSDLSGEVKDAVLAPASGTGAALHVAGAFKC